MKLITGITEITVIMGNNRNGKIMDVFEHPFWFIDRFFFKKKITSYKSIKILENLNGFSPFSALLNVNLFHVYKHNIYDFYHIYWQPVADPGI